MKQEIRHTKGTQEIKFTVKRIENRNHENGYTFLTAKAQPINCKKKSGLEEIKVRGYFPTVFEGEGFEAKGHIYDDYIKGPIFDLEGLPLLKEPQLEKEIMHFLRKRVEKLGSKTGKDIVQTLGLNCLKEINEQGIDLLMTVPNMTEKKAQAIVEAIQRQKTFEPLLAFLIQYQLEPQLATPIYEAFASNSLPTLKHNPYVLTSINNTSFSTADFLAVQLEFPHDHSFRVQQAILSCLEHQTQGKGDMCIRKKDLPELLTKFLKQHGHYQREEHQIEQDKIDLVLEELLQFQQIVEENSLVNGEPFLYLKLYHWVESGIVTILKELCEKNKQPRFSEIEVQRVIDHLESESPFPFDSKQKDGIMMGAMKRISILTGGPGTGKNRGCFAVLI